MDHRGIAAVASAVVLVLDEAWQPGLVDGATPEFASYRPRDLATPMTTGLSVLVHQVVPVPAVRPVGGPPGTRTGGVTLEVHLLVTAWGDSAPVEQGLLGWAACVLDGHPVLDAGLLARAVPGVCAPGEVVEVRSVDADLHRLWRALGRAPQPSLPYVTSALHLTASPTALPHRARPAVP